MKSFETLRQMFKPEQPEWDLAAFQKNAHFSSAQGLTDEIQQYIVEAPYRNKTVADYRLYWNALFEKYEQARYRRDTRMVGWLVDAGWRACIDASTVAYAVIPSTFHRLQPVMQGLMDSKFAQGSPHNIRIHAFTEYYSLYGSLDFTKAFNLHDRVKQLLNIGAYRIRLGYDNPYYSLWKNELLTATKDFPPSSRMLDSLVYFSSNERHVAWGEHLRGPHVQNLGINPPPTQVPVAKETIPVLLDQYFHSPLLQEKDLPAAYLVHYLTLLSWDIVHIFDPENQRFVDGIVPIELEQYLQSNALSMTPVAQHILSTALGVSIHVPNDPSTGVFETVIEKGLNRFNGYNRHTQLVQATRAWQAALQPCTEVDPEATSISP